MDLNKAVQSKGFKIGSFVLSLLLALVVGFAAGKAVGYRKATFSYRWGESYHKNFAGPRGGFLREFSGQDFMEASGAFGRIAKIDGAMLVVASPDDAEKVVLVNAQTIIKRFRDTVAISDLKVDDDVVVVGEPNSSGQIEAKVIRVMPPRQMMRQPGPSPFERALPR